MLRRQLLVAAGLAFLGAAAQQSSAALQPRNGRIAFTHLGASARRDQIYTTNATGSGRRQLTRSRKFNSFAPSYSPNAKRIVFVRAFRQSDLWQMRANGTGPRRLTWTQRISEATP